MEIHWDREAVRRMVPKELWKEWGGDDEEGWLFGYVPVGNTFVRAIDRYEQECRQRGAPVIVFRLENQIFLRKRVPMPKHDPSGESGDDV